jgi:hypothetical protein
MNISEEILCSPKEYYLDETDANGNLALRKVYTGSIDHGVLMNGQLDQQNGVKDIWWASVYISGALCKLEIDDDEYLYGAGRYYDAASPGVTDEVIICPVINEVTPDPKMITTGTEYIEQLTLAEGSPPITWTKLQGPSEAQVDSAGRVYGWTPTAIDIGSQITFEIRANNSAGDDTESWDVTVESKGDFDIDRDVDQEDFGHLQACFSGATHPYEAGCEDADLDRDDDVDLEDFAEFQECMAGANQPPAC